MTRRSNATNWPAGTLRPFESIQAISAKLAIFNHVPALRYEPLVRESDPRSLARLLAEPLSRVRTVTELPPWHRKVERFIERSTIFSEPGDRTPEPNLKYCARCLESFYHSCLHSVSWMEHCFVHPTTRLTVSEKDAVRTDACTLVARLHGRWLAEFGEFLREPQKFNEAFSSLSVRKLMRKARTLGALFEPAQDARLDKLTPSEAENPEAVKDEAESGGTPAADVVTPSQARFDIDSAWGKAPSRIALVRGLVSTLQGTTEHPLNQTRLPRQVMRGAADFSADLMRPSFWGCMAYVASATVFAPEHALLLRLLRRISDGHEACFRQLKLAEASDNHRPSSNDEFDENKYIAYRLRREGMCPRLVTLDIVRCLLHPLSMRRWGPDIAGKIRGLFDRNEPPLNLGLIIRDFVKTSEWEGYSCRYDARRILPAQARMSFFEQHLRALEWALFRRESLASELGHIDQTIYEIARDMRIVVIETRRSDDGISQRYFDSERDQPDWSKLTRRRPSHIEDSCRLLKTARTNRGL